MILEHLINMFFLAISGLLGFLPELDLHVESAMFNNFLEVVRLAGYLVPVNTVVAILSMVIALQVFTIAMAVIRFVVSIIRG